MDDLQRLLDSELLIPVASGLAVILLLGVILLVRRIRRSRSRAEAFEVPLLKAVTAGFVAMQSGEAPDRSELSFRANSPERRSRIQKALHESNTSPALVRRGDV